MENAIICLECAAKIRLSFPRQELVPVGETRRCKCGHCRKNRHCVEYARRWKQADTEGR